MYEKIVNDYRATESLSITAALNNIGWQKARKILIAAGEYTNDTVDVVRRLYEQ